MADRIFSRITSKEKLVEEFNQFGAELNCSNSKLIPIAALVGFHTTFSVYSVTRWRVFFTVKKCFSYIHFMCIRWWNHLNQTHESTYHTSTRNREQGERGNQKLRNLLGTWMYAVHASLCLFLLISHIEYVKLAASLEKKSLKEIHVFSASILLK